MEIKAVAKIDIKVQRGPESWAYIYITLGFALTIEGAIISYIPFIWPCNLIFLLGVFLLTIMFFTRNRWFQNKLISLKIKSERQFL